MANVLTPILAKVLQVAKLNVPVTPTEINDHIGAGNYASKYVLYLKNNGFEFSVNKSGRTVVSYTLIKQPANAEQLINDALNKKSAPKSKKTVTVANATKPVKVNTTPKTKAKTKKDIKAKNLETLRAVGANFKPKNVREFDDVTEQFGSSGEIGTSYTVDGDWDSIEGVDLQKLVG